MNRQEHWERVYRAKETTRVSWYAPHLARSIAIIRAVADLSAEIIDVGGGASTLVDDLLSLGHTNVSVLDISSTSIATTKARLGARSARAKWIVGDITSGDLARAAYDVWHDRALFHFVTDPKDRRAYVELAGSSLKIGGHAILATFSLEGPTRCSDLDVVRYSGETLRRELGPAFVLKQEQHESHHTPSGVEQRFVYCLFERVKAAG